MGCGDMGKVAHNAIIKGARGHSNRCSSVRIVMVDEKETVKPSEMTTSSHGDRK